MAELHLSLKYFFRKQDVSFLYQDMILKSDIELKIYKGDVAGTRVGIFCSLGNLVS